MRDALRKARTLARQQGEDPEILYADTSLPKHGTRATAVVTTNERLVTSASIRTTNPSEAEELVVALALAQPGAKTVVKDSKTAYASYRKGRVSPAALALLSRRRPPGRAIEVVWVPAHSQVEGNELADHYARELTNRAGTTAPRHELQRHYRAIQGRQV